MIADWGGEIAIEDQGRGIAAIVDYHEHNSFFLIISSFGANNRPPPPFRSHPRQAGSNDTSCHGAVQRYERDIPLAVLNHFTEV